MAVICQACQQRPALLHLTESGADGTVREAHLCPQCAGGLNLGEAPPPLAGLITGLKSRRPAAAPEPACPECGFTMAQYRDLNLLGCPACWTHLWPQIEPMVRRFHGTIHHAGRSAQGPDPVRTTLERDLAAAVAEERFEDAARLRDRLRHLPEVP
jgi:protein arginine kinase activator